ncbi:MAG: hypothetical protein AVDCRST_MAG06-3154, partial [uncultured Nocardioides sp.]
ACRGAARRPAEEARDRQPDLHRGRCGAAGRRRRAHPGGRHGPVVPRVRGAAAVLRPAAGRRPLVVAVDLPGGVRPRPLRLGVLPASPAGARGAHRGAV